MANIVYRDLTAKELDFIIAYAANTNCGELSWLSVEEAEKWEPLLDRLDFALEQINSEAANEQQ